MLQEKGGKQLAKEAKDVKKRKRESSCKNKASELKRSKKTENKQEESSCMYCGEGVTGYRELWLQCLSCQMWAHE